MLTTTVSTIALAAAGASFRLAVRPPKDTLTKTERAKKTDLFSIYIDLFRKGILLYQAIIYSISLSETTAYLLSLQGNAPSFGTTINRKMVEMCPTSSLSDRIYPNGQLSPLVWIACLCMTFGALFRAWSQDSLGQFFTWEPAIRPGHKLYTAGPYSIVRHPSYTGADILYGGQILFGFAKHTFLSECVAWKYPFAYSILCVFVVLFVTVGVLNMQKRVVTEDEMLKKEFGKEWEEWARKTRYRLFPGIW